MAEPNRRILDLLPVAISLPQDPPARKRAAILRIAGWVAMAALLVGAAVQFENGTVRHDRKARQFDRAHPEWTAAMQRAGTLERPDTKGAVARWRDAVYQFWAGYNIYEMPPEDPNSEPVVARSDPAWVGRVYMHPNSPPVVLLLTPFAFMPVWLMAALFNLLKLATIVMAVWMSARLVSDSRPSADGRPGTGSPADTVLALGLLWALVFLVGDIQHGNTNVFVLGAIVLHLWLFRRGRDGLAGLPLALAICLKMTPALFVAYWAWQRNWRLLAGTVISLAALMVVIPAAVTGPQRYAATTRTWLDNMVLPGLVRAAWYPIHNNQSMSGVVSRYFLPGPNGDVFWGYDDAPYYSMHLARVARDPSIPADRWITLAPLGERTARWVLRGGQLLVVGLMFWAIGWRRLPRDDSRRSIHYALVLLAMLILNQRTWQHHAAILLPATVALWAALARPGLPQSVRRTALAILLAVGLCLLALRNELLEGIGRLLGMSAHAAERQVDVIDAYGPLFYCFLLLFAAAVLLARADRRRDARVMST